MLEILQYISIAIEVIIMILGILIAVKNKKTYGWLIFSTFAIYVFYDSAKLGILNISANVLSSVFFISTLSILLAVWMIYKDKKK